MKKLHITSRVIIAIASLCIIVAYFFPVWRIDLFAPQYPEGLVMKIWLNNISGDVDIINGLNHYIGMKKISVEMFPELSYLIYIVAAFIIYGLVIAVTGNRKILFISYLVTSAVGGALAIYDFYQWGYDYGHNLNPDAPIKVPGMGYQPPLIGHKKLLNFDAYSMPDVGGYIVIGVVAIAAIIWFIEKKKIKIIFIMRNYILLLFIAVIFSACSQQPQPINYGNEECAACKMTIMDKKFGAEIISVKGKVYKFDDLVCMVEFLNSGKISEKEVSKKLVTDYEKENNFLDAELASYYVSQDLHSPMNGNAAAFLNKNEAQKYQTGKQGIIMDWKEVYNKLK